MNRKNELLIRVYFVLLLFTVVAVVLFSRVVKISLGEGDRWRAAGDSLYVKYIPIEAERGDILADDGSLLATSLQFFDIRVDLNSTAMTDETFMKHVDSLAICLSAHVDPDRSPQQYKNWLIRKRKEGERYLLIMRDANYEQMKRINSFPLFRLGRYKGGLILERKNKRENPYRQLAARTIGNYRQNAQMIGLEGYFNDILAGREGKRLMQKVSFNTWIPVNDLLEVEPTSGMDIQTTINMDMQDVVHHALLRGLEKHRAERGVAIVMEVETGAIKAISNLRRVEGGYAEIYNDAVGTAVEPGSTWKLASIMALLEDGMVDLDDEVNLSKGRAVFCASTTLEDSERHDLDWTSVQHAFEISSNVGMARLVSRHYKAGEREDLYIKRLRQFHLDETTGIEIKGEAQPFIKDARDIEAQWSCLSLPWMSIGYELHVTPLQLLRLYNAVANNGRMMKPYLVQKIMKNQKVLKQFDPQTVDEQIASPETIAKARLLLESVVENGTASSFRSDYLDFAGKTGTAQIGYSSKTGRKVEYRASFAGYFPANNPKYSCIVMITEPRQNGYYGGTVTGPVFKEIAEKCYGMESLRSDRTHWPVAEDQKVEFPLYQVAYRSDIKSILDQAGIAYQEQTEDDFAIVMADENEMILKRRAIEMNEVPNVENMSLKDALHLLENRGLKVKVSGSGRVRTQSIPPGILAEAQTIELKLK